MFEDLKKEQRGGLPPEGSSTRSLSELLFPRVVDPRKRIFVLLALLVILLAIVIGLKGYSAKPEARKIAGDVPSVEVERETLPSGVPTLDRAYGEKIEDSTVEQSGRWEEEAVAYLLTEAKNTPAVHAYHKNLLPITRESAPAIDKAAAPWRFQFVKFRGLIEFMKEADYEDAFGGDESIGRVHFGRLKLDDGEPPLRVYFVTPTMPSYKDQNVPDPIPPVHLIKDGWVRGRGIFVKRYRDVGPDGVEVPAYLVVATKIQRDFEPVPVETLEDIPFAKIDDDPELLARTPRGMNVMFKTYPQPLFRLVKYAEKRAGKEGAALREKEKLQPGSFLDPVKYEEVINNPAWNRKKYFGGLGATAMNTLYVGPDDMGDNDINDAGVREYVTGWIITDKEKLFKFAAPASVGRGLKMKTRVRYEGYFYKTQGYYARDGSWRLVPFLVLTVLEVVKPPPRDYTVQLVIAGAFILGICLLIFIIVREDKTKATYRRLSRRRLRTE